MRYLVAPCGLLKEDRVIRTKDGREMVVGEQLPIPEPDQLEPAAGMYLCRVVNDPRVTEAGVHIPDSARDNRRDYMRMRIVKVGPKKKDQERRYEQGMVVVTCQAAGLILGIDTYKPVVAFVSEDAIVGHVDYGPGLQ